MATTEPRRPVHLAVLVGLSAGAYAASLAGVTALQSSTDRQTTEARAPIDAVAAAMAARHDRLEADVNRAADAYTVAAKQYDQLSKGLGAMESSLDQLSSRVSLVTGAANALPGHVSLPNIKVSVPHTSAAAHAASGGSGG